ncbi:methylamine utilization protein [Xanthomonas arboricola]|uniref:methylamine utilization protein n=1 Tax=Xanthomonas arboricola TaxID=56448 RepID=UPI000CBF9C61|nr:methylamine utilization protein [Xanthomonas arboricola]MBB6256167.1 plastocyanin [Xanthomonas arboricola]MBB6574528.1 plastocyanin [Xanthomonas arboricola]SOU02540.1 lipoprotein [Xanthomonas arboricola pv. fragariae]
MRTQWFKRIGPVAGLLAYSAASYALATPLSVTVVDANGMLVDAVVSLEPARPVAASGTPRTVEMDQVNSQFVPAVLAVRTGTLVRFPNNDQIRHQVYSFSAAKRFELPLFQGSTAAPVRFDQAGLVTVGCNIHDWMLGYIVVVDTPYFGKTGSDGRVQLDAPAGNYTLRVWHPRIKGAALAEPVALAREAVQRRVTLQTSGPAPAVAPPDARVRALQDKFRRADPQKPKP